jgi:hypothetical protein
MERYGNRNGNSGVEAYEVGPGLIRIQYLGEPEPYLYTDESAGRKHILNMQERAQAGKGLATYVSRYVKTNYVKDRK